MIGLRTIALASCVGLVMISAAAAQRRLQGAPPTLVPVTIALQAGGDAYQFSGQASCTYAPIASIGGVLAEQWSLEQRDGSRSVTLTFWKPKNGSGDMFSLTIAAGGKSHDVSTVKQGGAPRGSGSATFASAGRGGTFAIDAAAADGAKLSGTIKCDAFSPAIAEGGD